MTFLFYFRFTIVRVKIFQTMSKSETAVRPGEKRLMVKVIKAVGLGLKQGTFSKVTRERHPSVGIFMRFSLSAQGATSRIALSKSTSRSRRSKLRARRTLRRLSGTKTLYCEYVNERKSSFSASPAPIATTVQTG